jgi:hypothetical protein
MDTAPGFDSPSLLASLGPRSRKTIPERHDIHFVLKNSRCRPAPRRSGVSKRRNQPPEEAKQPSPGAEALGKCGNRDLERRRCGTRDLIACVTPIASFNHPPTLSNCHPESPKVEPLVRPQGVGDVLRCHSRHPRRSFDLVMLSEAPRIGADYPYTMARSRSIPRMLTAYIPRQGVLTRLRNHQLGWRDFLVDLSVRLEGACDRWPAKSCRPTALSNE